jgi:hypothetical protein
MQRLVARYTDSTQFQSVYAFNKRPREFDFEAYLREH